MNQRREPRFHLDQQLWITVFGEPDICLPARIKNVSPRGIGLELQGPLATGSALKIEIDDSLLLGEVIYCRDEEGAFYIGVEFEHALYGLGDLAHVVRDYADLSSGAEQSDPVKNRRYQN